MRTMSTSFTRPLRSVVLRPRRGNTPEFADGMYHYHLTEDRSAYTVDCYHGEVEAGAGAAGGPPGQG